MSRKVKDHPLARMTAELEGDGWLSPDSYGRDFATAEDVPAVYLFLAIDMEDMERFHVAYVGMSRAVRRRWATHPTLREIRKSGWYVKRLFKPTNPDILRETERGYIQKFDPPWNLAGRRRGVAVQ